VEYVDRVAVLHIQLAGSLVLADRLAIEAEPHLLHLDAGAVTVRRHELAERRVLLDLEVNNAAILTQNFEVDMLGTRICLLVCHCIGLMGCKRVKIT